MTITTLREITKEELKEILKKHNAWLNDDPDGEKANLSSTNLSDANLSSTNLSSTNLSDANLDFSSGFSFQRSSFNATIDLKIGAQMAYHFCRMTSDDPEVIAAQQAIKALANKFHRVNECGEIK